MNRTYSIIMASLQEKCLNLCEDAHALDRQRKETDYAYIKTGTGKSEKVWYERNQRKKET